MEYKKHLSDGIYPEDIRNMTFDELDALSEEIRKKLISTVSKTGGHLASNLGVVELTLAIHRVFNAPYDKIIWDVGHQAYVHKLITGRNDKFDTLRQHGGISGFPKRTESKYDTFDTGHASNSVSAALGMAAARDIKGENYNVVAVIGDGALTGGMVYEAMNNAGAMKTPLVVILNDNEMSISKSEGGLAQHLSKLRSSEKYANIKKNLKKGIKKIPVVGDSIYSGLDALKDAIKYSVVDGMIFEELGFLYLGPVDGHNIKEMTEILKYAENLKKPVLVHCVTVKGKGYSPAEQNPSAFHGISPFDPNTGRVLKKSANPSYSEIFGLKLTELAAKNRDIIAVTAAMAAGTGLAVFHDNYPDRFFDVGIAEEHAVTFAAGAAAAGLHPVVSIYSTFFQRAYDQIMTDVCMQKLPVTLCFDRAGIVGADGETHHGIFDISYMMSAPEIIIFAPSDRGELEKCLEFCVSCGVPTAIRYPRGSAADLNEAAAKLRDAVPATAQDALATDEAALAVDKNDMLHSRMMCAGRDVTIISAGKMTKNALHAALLLKKLSISAEVIDARVLKPFDADAFVKSAKKTGIVFTMEDNVLQGGFGSSINDLFVNDDSVKCFNIGWPDKFISQGSQAELEKEYGLDAKSVALKISKILRIENAKRNSKYDSKQDSKYDSEQDSKQESPESQDEEALFVNDAGKAEEKADEKTGEKAEEKADEKVKEKAVKNADEKAKEKAVKKAEKKSERKKKNRTVEENGEKTGKRLFGRAKK